MDEQQIKAQIKQQFIKRSVTAFFDLIILGTYMDQPFSGPDTLKMIENKFDVHLSPGKVYSTLCAMDRKQLLRSLVEGSRRVYIVTKTGKLMLEVVTNERDMWEFVAKVRGQGPPRGGYSDSRLV